MAAPFEKNIKRADTLRPSKNRDAARVVPKLQFEDEAGNPMSPPAFTRPESPTSTQSVPKPQTSFRRDPLQNTKVAAGGRGARRSGDVKMPKQQRPAGHIISFQSVNGVEYALPTVNQAGKPIDPSALASQALLCSVIEIMRGGDPRSVLSAFGAARIRDLNNNPLYTEDEAWFSLGRVEEEEEDLVGPDWQVFGVGEPLEDGGPDEDPDDAYGAAEEA